MGLNIHEIKQELFLFKTLENKIFVLIDNIS